MGRVAECCGAEIHSWKEFERFFNFHMDQAAAAAEAEFAVLMMMIV